MLTSALVYVCKAATPKITNVYSHNIGLTENWFQDRLYKHKYSFKYESKKNATELSNFIWESKHANTETSLEWKIQDKATSYEPVSGMCMSKKEIPHPFLKVKSAKSTQQASDKYWKYCL